MVVTNERRTYRLREAAEAVGCSYWKAAEEVRRTNKFFGIDVLRIGRNVVVPRRALDEVLDGGIPNASEASE